MENVKKRALIGVISSVIGLFCHFPTQFLQIEGDGEEGKVHGDLVLAEVTEPFITHIVFHLAEDSLGFYTSSSSVFQSFFGGKEFTGLFLILVEAVIDFQCPPVSF